MAENTIKSDFHERVVEVIKELSELVQNAKEKDGKHRAIVILASEEVDEKISANAIGICGRDKEVCSVLHDFAKQPATAEIFKRVATGVALESILNKN